MQYPGYLLGGTIASFPAITGSDVLSLRFDGATTFDVTGFTGTNGQPKNDVGKIQQRILDLAPSLVPNDDKRLSELLQITCRWDEEGKRIVITSGRRGGVQAAERSSVEVLSTGGLTDALQLDNATAVDGRLHYHELPVPRAMLVDIRADFWADSQAHIAALADSATRLFPGRGSLVTQPALLARDVSDPQGSGTAEILLLPEGEPVMRASMVLLEASDAENEVSDPWIPRDRVTNRLFAVTGTLSRPTSGSIVLDPGTSAETLSLAVSPMPLIPSPFDAAQPAPRGMAVSLGVAFDASSLIPPETRRLGLLSLELAGVTVLSLEVVMTAIDNPDPQLDTIVADIIGASTFTGPNGTTSTAVTQCQVLASVFQDGAIIHASVDASTGAIELYVDGVLVPPLPLPYPQPARATGTFAAGYDMILTVGDADNELAIGIHHLHMFSEPLGAFDPRLRSTLTPAGRFAPGMRVHLAETEDGVRPGMRRTETTIVAVDAGTGTLTVSPAIVGDWSRARTLLFGEEYFVQQASARRRDDLVNNLYRFTVDYRVSALLEDETALAPQPAVEATEIVVDATGTNVPLARAPGVSVDAK